MAGECFPVVLMTWLSPRILCSTDRVSEQEHSGRAYGEVEHFEGTLVRTRFQTYRGMPIFPVASPTIQPGDAVTG